MISSGFDSALDDPIGHIALTPIGYAWMTHGLLQICPKVLVFLEGGYNLENLANCSEAVLKSLFIKGEDEENFSKLLKELGASQETYEALEKEANSNPRPYFTKLIKTMQGLLEAKKEVEYKSV